MPKTRQDLQSQPNFPELEQETQVWWEDTNAFQQSVDLRPEGHAYVFYDGPPFATGMPHYGHLLASTIKDVVPRYWTMKGYRVGRVWGWDCHGLPIENMIEKLLDIKGGKKGIEELGIGKFNDACQTEVMRLDSEWEKVIGRLGRWVDFKNNYKTMDSSYMESVWWGFQQLHEKGLVYEGRKVVLYCPRCSTPLSNFEIAMDNSYQDVEDDSVYVKFQVTHKPNQKLADRPESLVAWTTTPWTLPGNVGLAVHPTAQYALVETPEGDLVWLAQEKATEVVGEDTTILKTVAGTELAGWEYQPLYDYLPIKDQHAYYVMAAEFVTLTEGTGIVHTAAMYGEDDYQLAVAHDLPRIPMIDDEGHFMPFVELVAGKFYKQANHPVLDNLNERGLVLKQEKIKHSYPFCYRCSTPLFYNAVPAWFINVQKIKDQLISKNEDINWYPEHLKHGRFLHGLENAPDWNISRSRYWGTPMPIWKSADGEVRIIGSLEELKKWAVDPKKVAQLTDIHRQYLDDLDVYVDEAKTKIGKRIPEVFDCWVESGSMPFASVHYPFENKDFFDRNYPAQFVSEYIAQTRAWFYCMHVISVGIFGKPPFENVLTTGTILAEDGSKMSKSKKNYPDPMELINEYGVDSLRLYLMSSPVMKGENLNFSKQEVADIRRRVFVIWWNMLKFYDLFSGEHKNLTKPEEVPTHIMDQWLVSQMETLTGEVTQLMDNYDVVRTSRQIMEFVDTLSTWYLRLSRDRLREDNQEATQVFGYALYTLAQLVAPFAPFFAEVVHQNLVDASSSIHHTNWPEPHAKLINLKLDTEMAVVQKIVELGHAHRKEAEVKVRQPLAAVTITSPKLTYATELAELIKQELNIKEVVWQKASTDQDLTVKLDLHLTDELKAEGEARELARQIQNLRKKLGLKPDAKVAVTVPAWPESWESWLKDKTNTTSLKVGPSLEVKPE